MTIGPFTTYAPPGVYTRTITEPIIGQLLGGLRIPVIIGVGQETIAQTDFEIIRGSSSVADTPIFGEDPSGRWVLGGTPANPTLGAQDGNRLQFRVRNFPIVDGEGIGRVTFEVTRVSVFVNGDQAVVSAVDGTNGLISLLVPPGPNDTVSVNYFFKRTDTSATDDVTDQITEGAAILVAPKDETYEIVSGTNDELLVYVDDSTSASSIPLTAGTRTATDIANDVNAAAITGLTASVWIDNQGLSHPQLIAFGNLLIGSGTANGILGYNPGDYTNRTRAFRVFNGPIVDGSNGGITTTEPSKVTVLVNGLQVVASAVDGQNSLVTLPSAPRDGATVTIEYYFNTYQDTFDYLPNNNVVSVQRVGIAPGRSDFLNGPDFIIVNEGDQSKILWGSAFTVAAGDTTGTTDFDSTQISGMLVDDRIYALEATRFTDPVTNTVSTTKFEVSLKPTTGNGRDTPLGSSLYQTITNGRIDLPTNRPDLVIVHVGKNVRDALAKPPATVLEVDSATNTFILKDPVPADLKAFATFWYNRLADDTYTLSVTTAGASGVGKFGVTSQIQNNATLYHVRFGTKSALPQIVQWPSGSETVPDAIHYGGLPISETVTVEFDSALLPATHASFINSGAEPYDLYTASKDFGGVVLDGFPAITVDLSTNFPSFLVSQPIENPGSLVFAATDRLAIEIDGISMTVDVSGAGTVAAVVIAINAEIDGDVQVHPDGSPTFAATAPNNLASAITYGTEELLAIAGRASPIKDSGEDVGVKIISPTAVGETDASSTLGFTPNEESVGNYNALNQPARIIPTQIGAYNITSGVDDLFLFNIDGTDYTATLPSGSAVPVAAVVNYINAGYAANAPAADQATMLAGAIVVANEFRTDYTVHIASGVFHPVPDVTNTIASPAATDLPSLITLLTEAKAKYNLHISNGGGAWHVAPDTVNVVTAPDPTDLQSCMILAYDLKTEYNTHIPISPAIHSAPDGANDVTASNSELVAVTGLALNLGKFTLWSQVNTVSSIVSISVTGTANTVLGFTAGDSATRQQPGAMEIAAQLNLDGGFAALGVAWPVIVSGLGTYLRIDSLTAGALSTISFTTIATSALHPDTGMGIEEGTDGDSGEAAQAGYTVTSSNPSGSNGTGVPGQTYTDAVTGLRFTVLEASAGDYATAGSFTLIVDSSWTADASIPSRGIPGLETTVFNTLNMGVETTALVKTFNRGGAEPANGDVYYTSYQFAKSDLDTRLFSSLKAIQANFGPPTPEYPLSLGARLSLLNGAVLVGLKQVLKATGSQQASTGSYTAAIDELKKPIEGSVKPDVITPLATDPDIFGYLNQHCAFMSSPRQEGERTGVVGVAAGTTPSGVQTVAAGLASELMVVTYPDSYVITVQDDAGNSFDQLVDSSFMAAALAGTSVNPAIDVATPWTRRAVLGFKQLGRILDPTEANQVAVSGVSVIEQSDAGMRVRHGLTTRLDTVITRTPSVTLTIQFVQQGVRRVLDPFIGQKFTGNLLKNVENALVGMFATLIDQQIVQQVAGIAVTVDEDDPTIMRTESIYVPVFPLEYIVSTLQIRIRL
jgi:hypothetical protein